MRHPGRKGNRLASVDPAAGVWDHRALAYPAHTLLLIGFPIAGWLLASIPAYVVGSRLGVVHPAEARSTYHVPPGADSRP
jgi:hypothetical protein